MIEHAFKHVCFKDLEGYFKKSEYFSDLTDDEKEEIKLNLGISSNSDFGVYKGSYKYIKEFVERGKLVAGYIYIIDDFQTIYEIDGEVFGTDTSKLPSLHGLIMLIAVSENKFSDSGLVVYGDKSYEIEFDFTSKKYDKISTKGTITYLRDSNNNYAFYDFKNIRFKRTVKDLEKTSFAPKSDLYFYTFDSGKGEDNSDNVYDNHLEKNTTNVVFLNEALNNTIEPDCDKLTFLNSSRNNSFYSGCKNVIFTLIVQFTRGTLSDKVVEDITSTDYLKEFCTSPSQQICIFYDPITQTFLTEIL